MTALGAAGLLPFVFSAGAMWFTPSAVALEVAQSVVIFVSVYGAVIAAYLAGANAGARLAPHREQAGWFTPGQLLLLIAFFAALPIKAIFSIPLVAELRLAIIAFVLIMLCVLDLRAIRKNTLPQWYGTLRLGLTMIASTCLLLVSLRIILWGSP